MLFGVPPYLVHTSSVYLFISHSLRKGPLVFIISSLRCFTSRFSLNVRDVLVTKVMIAALVTKDGGTSP